MGTIFYKYKKIDEFLEDSLSNAYMYLSSPKQLNDPFDCKIVTNYNGSDDEIMNWVKNRNSKLIPDERAFEMIKNGVFDEINDDDFYDNLFGIFCLTDDELNNKMWAHYGNNNSGICLGFETVFSNGAYLVSVIPNSCQKRYTIKIKDSYYSILIPIIYDKNEVKEYSLFNRNTEVIKEGYRHKTPAWKDEREQRLLFLNTDNLSDDEFRKLYFKQNILKEIIFGYNVHDDVILQIKKIVAVKYSHDLKYYRTIPDKKTLRLEKIEINA